MSNQQSEQPAAGGGTVSDILQPESDTFESINNFVHDTEVHFEELQYALLGLANRHQDLRNLNVVTNDELTAALIRIAELEAQFQADGNRVSHLQMQLTQALAANEKLTAERDAALRERDDLRQRLDTMAATMFPIETPKGDA